MVISEFSSAVLRVYNVLHSSVPRPWFLLMAVIFFSCLITLFSIIILKFYKTLSKRNILSLNLNQYNYSNHPVFYKINAILFYFIEYIIIMPILITIWFAILSIIILITVEKMSLEEILLISASIIAATRMLAYYSKEIAVEIAKLLPLITLSLFLVTPEFFSVENIVSRISDIPSLLSSTGYFILAIFLVEIILRFFYTIGLFFESEG